MLYEIPLHRFDHLADTIVKLNRRAIKLGCAPITITKGREFIKDVTTLNGPETHKVRFCKAALQGDAPVLNGWKLIGTIQHLEEVGAILRAVPGEVIPEQYRGAEPGCDHCRANRRRLDTFIVRHQDGTVKQVGRDCLADFLGHDNPHDLARYAELVALAGEACCAEEKDRGGSSTWLFDVVEFLAYCAVAIRQNGWTSRKDAAEVLGRTSTADQASALMFPIPGYQVPAEDYPTDQDRREAEAAVVWAKDLNPTNDYEHNVKAYAESGLMDLRAVGIVASMTPGYRRELEKQLETKRSANSQYVGTVESREVFRDLTVLARIGIESQYGIAWLTKFLDPAGNTLIWFGTGVYRDQEGRDQVFEIGKSYTVKATVKEHAEYKGSKQTKVNRVVLYVPKVKKSKRVEDPGPSLPFEAVK
jgi:hypothetical protein